MARKCSSIARIIFVLIYVMAKKNLWLNFSFATY
jgi:hypothetical protein